MFPSQKDGEVAEWGREKRGETSCSAASGATSSLTDETSNSGRLLLFTDLLY